MSLIPLKVFTTSTSLGSKPVVFKELNVCNKPSISSFMSAIDCSLLSFAFAIASVKTLSIPRPAFIPTNTLSKNVKFSLNACVSIPIISTYFFCSNVIKACAFAFSLSVGI